MTRPDQERIVGTSGDGAEVHVGAGDVHPSMPLESLIRVLDAELAATDRSSEVDRSD